MKIKRNLKRKRKLKLVKAYKKGYRDQLNGRSVDHKGTNEEAIAYNTGVDNAKKGVLKPVGIK